MGQIVGGCLCGAVRYKADAEPLMTAVCHCTHCQKQAGSAFSMIVGVPKGSVKFEGGPLSAYTDSSESGLPVVRKFCPKCGSPVLSEVGATPEIDWIKAGTLDDPSWFKPQVYLWCDSAQPWVSMVEGVPQFPGNPPG